MRAALVLLVAAVCMGMDGGEWVLPASVIAQSVGGWLGARSGVKVLALEVHALRESFRGHMMVHHGVVEPHQNGVSPPNK